MPSSPLIMGREFSVHLMVMGTSPFCTMHWTPAFSPVFTGSSPNEKGAMDGGTDNEASNGWIGLWVTKVNTNIMKTILKRENFELILTIDCQHGRLSGLSRIVGSHAGVVPCMTSPNRLYAQHADALAVASDDYTIVGEDSPPVLGPGNVEWKIALVDCAIGGDHVQFIDTLLAKVKRHNLGQD